MPRRCSVCDHVDRPAIDRALVENSQSLRDIARQFGLGKDALARHKKEHIPTHVALAREQMALDAGGILLSIEALHDRAIGIFAWAEQAGDLRTALGAIREARQTLETLHNIRLASDQMLDAEQAGRLVDALTWAVRRHIHDRETLAAIQGDVAEALKARESP